MRLRHLLQVIGLYAVLMVGLVFLLGSARRWALTELASPDAQQQWETWREDVREGQDPQSDTVERRVPGSSEPPALVLMRDYYWTCLIAAVGLSTLLYAVLAWFFFGAVLQQRPAGGELE